MLYSGDDLHRRVVAICTVEENGTVIARTKMKEPLVSPDCFRAEHLSRPQKKTASDPPPR